MRQCLALPAKNGDGQQNKVAWTWVCLTCLVMLGGYTLVYLLLRGIEAVVAATPVLRIILGDPAAGTRFLIGGVVALALICGPRLLAAA